MAGAAGPAPRALAPGGHPWAPGRRPTTGTTSGWLAELRASRKKSEPAAVDVAEAILDNLLLPSAELSPALERAAAARTARSAVELLAEGVQLLLNSPNALAHTTWAPVSAADGDADVVAHYVARGLLRRTSDGQLYARVRDPSGDGNAPTHNRALGIGDAMVKGGGICVAPTFTLPSGGRLRSAIFYDGTARPMHRFKGALTEEQARALTSPAFAALAARFQKNLDSGPAALQKLACKHHISQAAIPTQLLTLKLDAIPVQVLDEDARTALRGMKGARVRVPKGVGGARDDVVWVKPDALLQVAFKGTPPPSPVQLVVHLYSAHAPALRMETLALPMKGNMLAERGFACVPRLVWDHPMDIAQAAVRIGYWQPFFADYGWELRHEPSGLLRVYSTSTQTALVVDGDTRAGALRACEFLHEGAAVLNGLLVRALWQEGLSATAHAGGSPFQGRNGNPRARLDWDTVGDAGGARNFGDLEVRPRSARETRKYELAYTIDRTRLTFSAMKEGSPIRSCGALWRTLGLPSGPETLVAERRTPFLIGRIATHGVLDRYVTGEDRLAPPVPVARVLRGRSTRG